MSTSYQKGYYRELEFIKKLRESRKFHTIIRSAGSRSPFDIVAISKSKILLIQVKSNKGRKALKELRKIKVPQSCEKQLWLWKRSWKLLFKS